MEIKKDDLVYVTSVYYHKYKGCVGKVLSVKPKYYVVAFEEMDNQILNLYSNELRLLNEDELNIIDLIE